VAIIQFRDEKIGSEYIYWDEARVLVQIRLLDGNKLNFQDDARPQSTIEHADRASGVCPGLDLHGWRRPN
jgi:hypothetical protein